MLVVLMLVAVWLCVRVRAADGLSAVGVCAGLGVGCRALRSAPVAPGGGVRVAHVFGACSGRWCGPYLSLPCVRVGGSPWWLWWCPVRVPGWVCMVGMVGAIAEGVRAGRALMGSILPRASVG